MAYFNELSTDMLLVLNEKKTREEYHRESFKKKYNFVPDKPGSTTGTITAKDGKQYKVDMGKNKNVDVGVGFDIPRGTMAVTDDPDGKIFLDKKFFRLKGSNGSERRDAVLHHEVGHQNLHNTNPDAKTIESKNRTPEVFHNLVSGNIKDQTLGMIKMKDLDHSGKKQVNDQFGAKEYTSRNIANKEEKAHRNAALNAAKKYERQDALHTNATEYEADRFSANKTSERALKRGLRDSYNQFKKDNNTPYDRKTKNKMAEADMKQRTKALNDKDMRKSDVYK